jgi:hypothetical protein
MTQPASSAVQQVYNLIILDESGSMETISTSTINSFNELLQTMNDADARGKTDGSHQEHYVSLYVFNTSNGNREVLFQEPANRATPLNRDLYQPDSGTPLFDAMGFALHRHEAAIADKPNAVTLVTILTDGEENSSREYSKQAIKTMVERLKAAGWVFTYIGTDHDVEGFAESISITSTLRFMKTERGLNQMVVREKAARTKFYERLKHENPDELLMGSSDFYDDDEKEEKSS